MDYSVATAPELAIAADRSATDHIDATRTARDARPKDVPHRDQDMTYDILRRRLRGSLISVYEPGFGAAADAMIWNGRKPERRARLIVHAACVEDVQEAVRYAAAQKLTVSPRGGGHHFTGISTQADMVVDLGALDTLKIDTARRIVTAGPAVTNARLAAALDRHGLAFPVGHCGSVPISGYLLGGGFGWNSGAWGIACFSVEEAEIVTPDGELRRASATENADLFWAVRGAGPGFFGIVTAYKLKAQQAPRAIMSTIRIYPLEAAQAVAEWAEAVMGKALANVEFTVKISAPPPQMNAGDRPCIEAIATVFASGESEARTILSTLGEGAPETIMTIFEMPATFDDLYGITAQSTPQGHRYAVDTLWSDSRLPDVLPIIANGFADAPSRDCMALMVLRSPQSAVPGDAAFSKIGRIFGAVYAIWEDSEADAAQFDWLRGTMARATPLSSGVYVGEGDIDLPERHAAAHSAEATARLSALRAAWDPAGLFGTALRPQQASAA